MSIILFVERDSVFVDANKTTSVTIPDSVNRVKLALPESIFYAFYEIIVSTWLGRNLRLEEVSYDGDLPEDFDLNWFDYRFVDNKFVYDKCISHHAKSLIDGKAEIYQAIETYKKQVKVIARRGLPLTLIDYIKIIGCKNLLDKQSVTVAEATALEAVAKSKNLTVDQLHREITVMTDYINSYSLNLILDKHSL